MTMKKTAIISLALATLAMSAARAQDAHFSQYDAAAIMLNPAHTGMFENNDFRVGSNLRNQWGRLGANFLTTAFAVDVSMQEKYGFGAYLNNYNMAGIVNTFQTGVTAGYNVSKPKARHTLSAGVNLGLIYKKVNDSKLVWDAQYDRDHFNSDLPSGEDFRKAGRWMPDIGVGMAYRSKDPNRTVNPFANFALFHVTMPDESIFREEKSRLPMRWSVNGGARITIAEGTDLMPQALYMRQGPDQQIQAGMLGQMSFWNNVYSVVAGASYRWHDAIIAQAGIKHGNTVYRISYDVNVSSLKQYTRSNGALEFSIVYYGTLSGRSRRVTSSAF